jgi:hypothetical protein
MEQTTPSTMLVRDIIFFVFTAHVRLSFDHNHALDFLFQLPSPKVHLQFPCYAMRPPMGRVEVEREY